MLEILTMRQNQLWFRRKIVFVQLIILNLNINLIRDNPLIFNIIYNLSEGEGMLIN